MIGIPSLWEILGQGGYRLFSEMGQYVSINNRRGYRLFAKMGQYVSIAITVFSPEWVSMSVLPEWVRKVSIISIWSVCQYFFAKVISIWVSIACENCQYLGQYCL